MRRIITSSLTAAVFALGTAAPALAADETGVDPYATDAVPTLTAPASADRTDTYGKGSTIDTYGKG